MLLIALVAFGFSMTYQRRIFIFSNANDNPITEDRISFLVLGETGRPIGWNFAPDLTDTMMLVDYRPKVGVANLVSLPRDTFITIDGQSFKMNEAFKRGKMDGLLNIVQQMTGIKTDKYVVVTVDLLKTIVDNLGGIDIDMKANVIDSVSGYTIHAGKNHLDGNQVVFIARNRYAPEGDFFREKNQQDVIRAMLQKIRSLNMLEKATFLFKMTPELAKLNTNINFQELLPLADKFEKVRLNNVVVDFKTGILQSANVPYYGSSTAYALIPRAGVNNYSEMQQYIQSKIEK